MKLSKEYIQGYIDCAIKLLEFQVELNVRANVYFLELSQDYQVFLQWNTAYDNAKNEEVIESAEFSIMDFEDFEKFLTDFNKKLYEISCLSYDHEYDSREADAEFREESKFESNRGN